MKKTFTCKECGRKLIKNQGCLRCIVCDTALGISQVDVRRIRPYFAVGLASLVFCILTSSTSIVDSIFALIFFTSYIAGMIGAVKSRNWVLVFFAFLPFTYPFALIYGVCVCYFGQPKDNMGYLIIDERAYDALPSTESDEFKKAFVEASLSVREGLREGLEGEKSLDKKVEYINKQSEKEPFSPEDEDKIQLRLYEILFADENDI